MPERVLCHVRGDFTVHSPHPLVHVVRLSALLLFAERDVAVGQALVLRPGHVHDEVLLELVDPALVLGHHVRHSKLLLGLRISLHFLETILRIHVVQRLQVLALQVRLAYELLLRLDLAQLLHSYVIKLAPVAQVDGSGPSGTSQLVHLITATSDDRVHVGTCCGADTHSRHRNRRHRARQHLRGRAIEVVAPTRVFPNVRVNSALTALLHTRLAVHEALAGQHLVDLGEARARMQPLEAQLGDHLRLLDVARCNDGVTGRAISTCRRTLELWRLAYLRLVAV